MNIRILLPSVQENIPMAQYTTFKIGGPARYFYVAKKENDLITAFDAARKCGIPIFILGAGSNILVSDRGFPGLVIQIRNTRYEIRDTKIYCDAGVLLSFIAYKAAEAGLTGLEWAGGIPGTVGGSIRGNAGAFGGSMKDVVKSIKALDSQGGKIKNLKRKMKNDNPKLKILNLTNKQCEFGYRDSIFKRNPNFIILSAEFLFKKGDSVAVKDKTQEYLNYRKEKHPLSYPSAGSIFKNIKFSNLHKFTTNITNKKIREICGKFENIREVPAAYLISECGLKGKKNGGAMISSEHPNFIVNVGNAKAADVALLIQLVKKTVQKKFGILLEEEIQYIGF